VDEEGWEGVLISSKVKLRLEGEANSIILGPGIYRQTRTVVFIFFILNIFKIEANSIVPI
jgi:hypothetical protein